MWIFIKRLKAEVPYDPAISLLDIYPKKMKTLSQNDTWTPIFIAALFIIAKIWKQPKVPSTDDGFEKLCTGEATTQP